MPILPPDALAVSRALFGAVASGLYPHRARIERQGLTGVPSPGVGGVARATPVVIAAALPCRLGVATLPTRDGDTAGEAVEVPPYVLAFPVAADAEALDLQRGDAVTVTGAEDYPGAAFTATVWIVAVDVPKPSDVRRRATASTAPPGAV